MAQQISGNNDIQAWDGWISDTNTWTYVNPATLTVVGDYTAVLAKGDRLALTQTTVKYFYITATPTFSAGLTTVIIYGGTDYTLANAAITLPRYSKMASPNGFPQWFNYASGTSPWTASTTNPSIGNGTITARFNIIGTQVNCNVTVVIGSTTTIGSGEYRFLLPITAATTSQNYTGGSWILRQGTAFFPAATSIISVGSASTVSTLRFIVIFTSGVMTSTAQAWGNTDIFSLSLAYEI